MDAKTLGYSKNGTFLGTAFTDLADTVYPAFSMYNEGDQITIGNFMKGLQRKNDIISLKTFKGTLVTCDVSHHACKTYDYYAGDRVMNVPRNHQGTVVGVGTSPSSLKKLLFV